LSSRELLDETARFFPLVPEGLIEPVVTSLAKGKQVDPAVVGRIAIDMVNGEDNFCLSDKMRLILFRPA
jgi:hypothetical protein